MSVWQRWRRIATFWPTEAMVGRDNLLRTMTLLVPLRLPPTRPTRTYRQHRLLVPTRRRLASHFREWDGIPWNQTRHGRVGQEEEKHGEHLCLTWTGMFTETT